VFGKRLRRTTEGVTCNTNKILELEVRIADLEKQVQCQQELIIHSAKSVNQDSQTLRLTLKEIKNNMISSIEALKNEIVEDVKQEVIRVKGKWKPYSQVIGEERMYIAGRQLNMDKPLHGGNVEYSGTYTGNRKAVEALCESLNQE